MNRFDEQQLEASLTISRRIATTMRRDEDITARVRAVGDIVLKELLPTAELTPANAHARSNAVIVDLATVLGEFLDAVGDKLDEEKAKTLRRDPAVDEHLRERDV